MEISFSRFAQLTAMLAAGGTLLTACTVNNVQEAATGGSTSAANTGTGGASSAGGSSSTVSSSTAIGGGTAASGGATSTAATAATGGTTDTSTATVATGGATGTTTSTTSGTGGATGTSTISTSTAVTGGTTSIATSTGGAGGATTTSSTAVGGTTTTATDTTVTVSGGTTSTTSAATGGAGGATTVSTGGASTTGGATGAGTGGSTSSCVSGDPATESGGFNCSTLGYYIESCPDPTGEGAAPYGAQWCDTYASERVDAVKVFTDCISGLTQPATGWCGDEHKAAVDACRSQMLTKTCPSASAQTACEGIHAACSKVSVANCVADLSPLSDSAITSIEPCMEGAVAANCDVAYQACSGYPDRVLSVPDACTQLRQSCSDVDQASCEVVLNVHQTDMIGYYDFQGGPLSCVLAALEYNYPCAEAFLNCEWP